MPDQGDFMVCYRGRQSALHHAAYMRMAKVLLALRLCAQAGIGLAGQEIFDYGFGAGTFYRYCPRNSRLFGVEIDRENVVAVDTMLRQRGYREVDLQQIEIEHWAEHPLLARQYDVVLCSHVLEHLPDPVHFLRIIRGCVRETGAFVGLVPLNEREIDPHHVQVVTHAKVEQWAREAGLRVAHYVEADPWLYWFQPVFASNRGWRRMVAQALSLGIGLPATFLGSRSWFQLGKIFASLTASRPTQAAFILTRESASDPAR
jgi:2-polyprenyl-3-methyl-5-hydroxy-6-metoxy-1,4-benzoquinol methylase